MNLIDIIVIAVILLFGILGAVSGFFKTVFRFLAYVTAGIVSKLFSSTIATLIYDNFLQIGLINQLEQHLPEQLTNADWGTAYDSLMASLPQNVVKIAGSLNLLPDKTAIQNTQAALSPEGIEATFVMPIVTKILIFVVSIVLFSVVSILLCLIVRLINKRFFEKKHNALTATNRIFGFVLGLIRGLLPGIVVCLLFVLIVPLTRNTYMNEVLSQSYLCGFVTGFMS